MHGYHKHEHSCRYTNGLKLAVIFVGSAAKLMGGHCLKAVGGSGDWEIKHLGRASC